MYRYQARLIFSLHPAGGYSISALIKEIKPVKEIIDPLRSGFFFNRFKLIVIRGLIVEKFVYTLV